MTYTVTDQIDRQCLTCGVVWRGEHECGGCLNSAHWGFRAKTDTIEGHRAGCPTLTEPLHHGCRVAEDGSIERYTAPTYAALRAEIERLEIIVVLLCQEAARGQGMMGKPFYDFIDQYRANHTPSNT